MPRSLILVADDSEIIRRVVQTILRARGFRVLLAPTAHAALRIIARFTHRIDVMIAEVGTPARARFDFIAQVGRILPELPVLLMSGDFLEQDPGILARTGPRRVFVAKPFTQELLLAKLRSLLPVPAAAESSNRYKTASPGR